MSHGNLVHTLVAHHFWPACGNCRYAETCKTHPQHPAYPHRWHWGKETISFPEGKLVLRSWVGTAAIGQPHTGCPQYAVDPHYLNDLAPQHQHYLALDTERTQIEAVFTRFERKEHWTTDEEETVAELLLRYKKLLAQQAALGSAAPLTDVPALTVAA